MALLHGCKLVARRRLQSSSCGHLPWNQSGCLAVSETSRTDCICLGKTSCHKVAWSTEWDDPVQACLHCLLAVIMQLWFKLTQQLSASKTRTRHLSTRASWLGLHAVCTHKLSQQADILTKGLTVYVHELAREGLWLQICHELWIHHLTQACLICGLRVGTRGLEPPQGASGKTGPLRGLWVAHLVSRSVKTDTPLRGLWRASPEAWEPFLGSKGRLGRSLRDPQLLKREVEFRGP